MLFAKSNKAGVESIKKVLSQFCNDFGQLVSMKKSCVYFSPNVLPNVREVICDVFDISETSCIGKYLGFPLNHKGATRNRYNFFVERVTSKLSGWKAKFLSFVGRTVLIKSVMAAIPNHLMQGVALLCHLCEKLDKISRDFLWGHLRRRRNFTLWGGVTLLGLRRKEASVYRLLRQKTLPYL